jgi:hypothetical protein
MEFIPSQYSKPITNADVNVNKIELIDYSDMNKTNGNEIMKRIVSLLLSLILCTFSFAEGNANGGDDFRNTAAEYHAMAKNFGDKGKYDIAALYQRMSEIKLDAASKADHDKWDDIDWSEYHEIEKKLSKLMHHKK